MPLRDRFRTRWLLLLLGLALSVQPGTVLGSQQPGGTISGRITAADDESPVASAQVFLVGTNQSTLTTTEGLYRFVGAGEGPVQLRVVALGFTASSVTLEATSEAVVHDFALERVIFSFDEMVVTVTGQQRRREVGHAVGTIDVAQVVETQPVRTMSEVLTGRLAGVHVTTQGGGVGSGSGIRIRGANSISLSNEPIVYIDGIRVSSETFQTIFTGGQRPSRLDDLNPEDIESIEVAKGPSAATLYGTDAASGVILITSRRGVPGKTRWNAYAELASTQDVFTYPASYSGLDPDHPNGFLRQNCTLVLMTRGVCEQQNLESFAVMQDPAQRPFQKGLRQQYGLGVSGGSDQFQYRLSGEWEADEGVWQIPDMVVDSLRAAGEVVTGVQLRPNGLGRINVRGNLRTEFGGNADLMVTGAFVSSSLSRTANDQSSDGVNWGGLVGESNPDVRRGWGIPEPAQSMRRLIWQDLDRWTSGATLNWSPLAFLSTRGSMGMDYSYVNDHLTDFVMDPGGYRINNKSSLANMTADLMATAAFDIGSRSSSSTSVGFQYFSNTTEINWAQGWDMPFGCGSLSCAAQTDLSEDRTESVTVGFFVDQRFALDDRIFVSAGLRVDDNSAFGRDFDLAIYPKVQASWMVTDESFMQGFGFLDQLRLRAAWGASGRQPGSLENLLYYRGGVATIPAGDGFEDVAAVTIGEVGNTNLKPETSKELEMGLDVSFFDRRLALELTAYRKRTDDALVNRPIPPSIGASPNRFENVGRVKNDGFEIGLTALLLQTRDWAWNVTGTASTNQNELLELGEDATNVGDGMVVGYPLGGMWERRLQGWDDANGDGIIIPEELMVSDTAEFLGTPYSNQQATVSTDLSWRNVIRMGALFEFRGGGNHGNGTEAFRCALFRCRGLFDRNASLEEQAKAVAWVHHPSQTLGAFAESGDFAKLREVSLTFFLPQEWASAMRASNASISLYARNLKTWSPYSGFDPEISSRNFGDSFVRNEVLSQPPARLFGFRTSVTF